MVLNIRRKPYFLDVKVKDIKLDKAVQCRASINRSAVMDYADNYESGRKMPPITIFWIPGQPKWLADGFHRVLAKLSLLRRGLKEHGTIRAEIHTGSKRDAILFAAAANATNGVRRTNEDKAKTVLMFLGDREWCQWTDTEIARHAIVSSSMVAKYRRWLGEKAQARPGADGQEQRSYTARDGSRKYTSVNPEREKKLEDIVRRDICPTCGQRLKKGHSLPEGARRRFMNRASRN